jgi:hypothetical protein
MTSQVMSYLNELFTIFDELVDQYQIYKSVVATNPSIRVQPCLCKPAG